MAISLRQRVPENAPGDFYVEADTCMRCCLPHGEAPELMNDCEEEFRECYCRRQPQAPEELEHAIQAIWVSELNCIRYGGSDQAIIRRLHELGRGDCCDQPLIGEPAVRHPNQPARAAASIGDAIRVIRGANWDAHWEAERFLSHQEPADLVGYLGDEDWRVRLVVARALAQMPGSRPEVAEILKARFQVEDDDWVSTNLRWGVQQHGGTAD